MEKAILKTLIYSNIFDYPLRLNEIHKWLIGRKATPRDIEKTLKILSLKRKIREKKGYFFLRNREELVSKRIKRAKQSQIYIRKVSIVSQVLRIIPWVKLVGISGGLAMDNADKKDDIDLIIITSRKRIWLSRFFVLGLLNILGQRRKVRHSLKEVSGKICCNIFLEEENLIQTNHDLYTAHEVLQMKVLWQRDNVYSKYLGDNDWVFKFLPNWVGSLGVLPPQHPGVRPRLASLAAVMRRDPSSASPLAFFELLSKRMQLKIMKKPKGRERIEEGALYFHPNDIRESVLKTFKEKISKLEFSSKI